MSQDPGAPETPDPAPAASAVASAPWYNPDVSTLDGARRAILPGAWLTGGYAAFLAVHFIYQRVFNPATLGDYDPADILVVAPVFTALLILFALKASRIATGLMVMSAIVTLRHGVDVLFAGDIAAGLLLTATGAALTGLCMIGFTAAWRYHDSGSDRADA
ncbi:hypothetical protein [Maricaulis sp.]|uniref:hypothetical protein n=1 Tax=Maricaulis sp. TaxID=1486257 RepID=UPI003A8E37FA